MEATRANRSNTVKTDKTDKTGKQRRSFLVGYLTGSEKRKDEAKMQDPVVSDAEANPKQKKKKRGWLKKIFGKGTKKTDGGVDGHHEAANGEHEEDDLKVEPNMTLTQMVDMLTGKENHLYKTLQENFELHSTLLEEIMRLESEVSKPVKQMDPEKIKHELDSVKYYAEMGVQHQVKMCNYIKKTQQNLVMLIEQLALHEQNSDLRTFLRRETVIPGADIEEEEEEKGSFEQSLDHPIGGGAKKGRAQGAPG